MKIIVNRAGRIQGDDSAERVMAYERWLMLKTLTCWDSQKGRIFKL